MSWLILITIIVLWITVAALKQHRLATASPGTIHVETVKASQADRLVRRYQAAGWITMGVDSSKSFGTQARVTLIFRKLDRPRVPAEMQRSPRHTEGGK